MLSPLFPSLGIANCYLLYRRDIRQCNAAPPAGNHLPSKNWRISREKQLLSQPAPSLKSVCCFSCCRPDALLSMVWNRQLLLGIFANAICLPCRPLSSETCRRWIGCEWGITIHWLLGLKRVAIRLSNNHCCCARHPTCAG